MTPIDQFLSLGKAVTNQTRFNSFGDVSGTYRATASRKEVSFGEVNSNYVSRYGYSCNVEKIKQFIVNEQYKINSGRISAFGTTVASPGSGNVWDIILGKGTVPYNGKAFWGTNFIGPGPNADPYKLLDENGNIIQPIDLIDAAAQLHDWCYWIAGASGAKDAFFNSSLFSADAALASSAFGIMQGFYNRDMDPYTGQSISDRTYNMASLIYHLFQPISIYKTVISIPFKN